MAAWSSICWENDPHSAKKGTGGGFRRPLSRWRRGAAFVGKMILIPPKKGQAAVSAAPCPAPPAGGKTPNPRRPGGIVPPCPGVGKGAGPGGLWPPERRPGPAQREPRAGPRQGAAPTPPPGRWGGPAGGGRVRRRRGTDAGKAANPTPRRPQPATGPPPPRQSAPAGGLRPPAPRRPATRPDAGRPRAGRPAASHQPTPTAARAPGPGPDKAGPLRWGGGGRAGPVPARPAPDRPHTFFVPARHLWRRAGTTATGAAPAAGRSSARDSGRAEGPRGGRIRSRGHPSRSWGGVGGKKKAGSLSPRLDTTGRKKNAGRTLCPPRLPL